MTALAKPRTYRTYGSQTLPVSQNYPVKAGVKIYAGALVVLNAGYAAPATTATGHIAVGIAFIPPTPGVVDNTAGADGALTVEIEQGVHDFTNSSAGDLIAQTDVGADCWIVDDQTVAKTNGGSTRSRAGKVIRLEGGRVWVQTGIGV